MEEFVLTAQGSYFCLHAIGENEKCIVVEQMGDGVQVVGVVVRISILNINRRLFQLHKQQRNSIDETHDIRAAAVEIPMDFQLLNGQKVVSFRVVWVLKVNNHCPLFLGFAAGTLHCHRNSIPDQGILLLVNLHKGGC